MNRPIPTVTVALEDYLELLELKKGFDDPEKKLVEITTFFSMCSYKTYAFKTGDEICDLVVKSAEMAKDLHDKNYLDLIATQGKIESIKKMSIWQFIKFRKNG